MQAAEEKQVKRVRAVSMAVLCMLGSVVSSGCKSGPTQEAYDQLKADDAKKQAQIDALQQQVAQLQAAANATPPAPPPPPPVAPAPDMVDAATQAKDIAITFVKSNPTTSIPSLSLTPGHIDKITVNYVKNSDSPMYPYDVYLLVSCHYDHPATEGESTQPSTVNPIIAVNPSTGQAVVAGIQP